MNGPSALVLALSIALAALVACRRNDTPAPPPRATTSSSTSPPPTLGVEGDPVTVLLPNGSVAMAAGTTALVSVEDDGTTFIVVANGAAVLVEPFGSTMLPGGNVALVPVGCSPQVDEASFAEIEAEPLVASNRELDAGRQPGAVS